MQPARKELAESNAVGGGAVLTVQVLWACYAWNVTPEQAARQTVTDLFEHLSRGGTVPVRVEGLDGTEHELQVTAQRQ